MSKTESSGSQATEIRGVDEAGGIASRVLGGEVIVLRGILDELGLTAALRDASLDGIREALGEKVAAGVAESGFDRIHEWVDPAGIPAMTDAVSSCVLRASQPFLDRFVSAIFPEEKTYYFEKLANVRFHIPYDLAAGLRGEYKEFTQRSGQGKITAHGAHRDPWVDCPDNGINLWIAIGPVLKGNGLAIFARDYHEEFGFRSGYIEAGASLHRPMVFELDPGDVVLFHTRHLHGSELNRTDRTRFVISYRVTFAKPHYPNGHYHHYQHGGLAAGRWSWLAGVPQNLQMSFLRYQCSRLWRLVSGGVRMSGDDGAGESKDTGRIPAASGEPVAIGEVPVGSVCAYSENICLTRPEGDSFAAVGRRCTHMGGDLAGGWIEDGKLTCPMHNLPFDLETGKSACKSVKPLRLYPCRVQDGRVVVQTKDAGVL